MLDSITADKAVEGYRLSPQQKRLWMLQQSEPSTPYCAQCNIRIDGPLDPAVLKDAVQSAIDRHEILHTTFYRQPGAKTPVQVIAERGVVSWHEISLAEWDRQAQENAIEELYRADRNRSFDLTADSVLRATLLVLSADRHVLLLSLPALYADACAIENLAEEIASAYAALSEGRSRNDEVAQYLPFSEWQNELLEDDESAEGREYWQRKDLFSVPAVVLPFDRAPFGTEGFQPDVFAVDLDTALFAQLRNSAQRYETSIDVFLLACWQILLWRLTGETEIVVGNMRDLRNYEGMDKAIGLFARWLPQRCQLDARNQFTEILRLVHQHTVEPEEWQEYFVWELPGSVSHSSGFPSVGFEYAQREGDSSAGGVTFRISNQYVCHDRFKVKLSCVQWNGSLTTEFHYDSPSFYPGDIRRLAGEFHTLLASAVHNPHVPIGELEILSSDEREQLLAAFNQTDVEYPQGDTLSQLFEQQVAQSPEAIALVYETERVSYHELNRRANQLARHLQSLGVGPEVVVGLCVERSPEMVMGLLAILKAGGAYLPLDPAYPAPRLEFMMRDAQAKVLLTQQRLLEDLGAQQAEVLCLDADWESFTQHDDANLGVDLHSSNVAYMIYTSGSTGQPKGVMISQQAICNHMRWMQETFPLGADDAVLQKTPFSFDASVWEFYAPLFAGGRLVLARPGGQQDSAYLAETIADEGVTVLQVVPTLLRMLVQEPAFAECTQLKRVFCGGEILTRGLAAEFQARLPGVDLYNLYGPTEAAIDATYWQCEREEVQRPENEWSGVPIGRPIANLKLYVLDQDLKLDPVGVSGELFIGGAGLARGYHGRAELTAERFVPHPYSSEVGARVYRTGDVARYRPDGALEYVGRVDHQVKVRGYRIELGEIEAALLASAHVREAVVIVRGDGESQQLAAYVVCVDGAAPASSELRAQLQEHLPDYMVPSQYMVLERLPLTPNGKVDRQALAAIDAGDRSLADNYVAPRNPTEEILAGIWAQLLKIKHIGIHDDFFALGGHSLLATQLVSRVRSVFQVEVALRQLFDKPTIVGLVTEINRLKMDGDGLQSPPIERISRDEVLSLSYAQQRLWFLDQLEPNSSLYNIPAAVRLRGTVDLAALEFSFREIIRRHESLRTRFEVVNRMPVQVIDEAPDFTLPLLDLSTVAEDEREAEARRVAAEETQRPFDLAAGPLLRASVLRLSEQNHVLLCTMHHIISDGWSIEVLTREVATLYEAYAQGESSPLPELAIQYADFAHWQREWLQGEVLEKQLNYWKEQLAGAPSVLELPADYPRPAVQTFRGAHLSLTLAPELTSALKALTQREGATLFMTLLAAFQTLLSRYSGQEDVVVGTPIAGRNQAETENLIGFFINTLVLRTDLSGNPSFTELLRRVREVALGAYAHQEVPFEKLVEELQPERDASRSPLFQVLLSLQNAPAAEVAKLDGLEVRHEGGESGTSKFDLTLSISETSDGRLHTLWEYNTDLFRSNTIARMMDHFEVLLNEVVENPGRRLSELKLLRDEEQQQILLDWNSNAVEYPRGKCLHQLFEAQVERTPEAIALVHEDQELTYTEVNERANQLAHYLESLGVGPGGFVGICLSPSEELVIAVLGVVKAGAAYLPLDPAYPQERISLMLSVSKASVVLTEAALLSGRDGVSAATVVCVDSEWALIAGQPSENPQSQVVADNAAYLIFTSGSTGTPKAAAISHRSFTNLLYWYIEEFSITAADRVLLMSSISFDLTQKDLWGALVTGARLGLAPAVYDARQRALQIQAQQITFVNCTPSAFYPVVEASEDIAENPLGSLRQVILGGERITLGRLQRWLTDEGTSAEVVNTYGPTESTDTVTYHRVSREEVEAASEVPLGHATPNTQLWVADQWQWLVPVGVVSELWIGGVAVGLGYVTDAALTSDKFRPDPWSGQAGARVYRTGDKVRYLSNGELLYLGRIDEQVKIRGYRIELGEVEAALLSSAQVREAAVIVREDEPGDTRLVAYVVTWDDAVVTPGELRDHLKEQLPDYMVPSRFVMLAAMPLTPNGKLDRRALPSPDHSRPDLGGQFVAPRTPVEEVLTGIWCEVLRLDEVGMDDGFFELGGHSLLATQAISRVCESFGVDLDLRMLFEHPTVRGMATVVEEARKAGRNLEEPAIEIVSREQELPLSFAQQLLWLAHQLDPNSSAYHVSNAVRLTGALDAAAMEQALTELVRRHESLRTRFIEIADEPVQLIDPAGSLPFPVIDLSMLIEREREAEVMRLARQQAEEPFDLERGPLVRAALLRLGPEEHVLLFTMHHIISDAWSLAILGKEIAILYDAFSTGKPSPLPELPIQYADFAYWQRRLLRDGQDSQLQYWKRQLAGAPAVLELPKDRPRPVTQSFNGARLSFQLPLSTTKSLQELSRREGATLFMTLLAAFKVLLSRYSGQEDIVVGTNVANRHRHEIEGLIGVFINNLVLRTDLSGNPSFQKLIARVREVCLDAYAHQDVPFEKLVEVLQPVRDSSYPPLFQVMLSFQTTPVEGAEVKGITANFVEFGHVTARADLMLIMSETNQGLFGVLEYNTDLFDASTAARIVKHFETLLEDVVAHPDKDLKSISFGQEEERRVLISSFNQELE